MLTLSTSGFGLVDWHITDTAAAIENKRRQGWSDAKITEWLLSPEGKKACPWDCDDEKVAAAFKYLAMGHFPPGVECRCPDSSFSEECCPQHGNGNGNGKKIPWLWIGGGIAAVALVGTVVVMRRGKKRRRR